jgi:dihydrofolate reductase
VVINHITLDGVMQAPGRPDEDKRGGFEHGGWAIPGNDEVTGRALGQRMDQSDGALLLGRRGYDDMLSSWNSRGGPYKDALNSAAKYVASTSAETKLDWPNRALLNGDFPSAVSDLKRHSTGDVVMMGSGCQIRSLMPYGLIDEHY